MEKCSHPKQIVCDVEVCGVCYEKELLSSRDKTKPPTSTIEYIKDTHGHMAMRVVKHDKPA